MKDAANEAFGIFEKYKSGQCTYDRALEEVSNIMKKRADERPIVGYVKSGTIKDLFYDIFRNKQVDPNKSYMFDCKIHNNQMMDIERILKTL